MDFILFCSINAVLMCLEKINKLLLVEFIFCKTINRRIKNKNTATVLAILDVNIHTGHNFNYITYSLLHTPS